MLLAERKYENMYEERLIHDLEFNLILNELLEKYEKLSHQFQKVSPNDSSLESNLQLKQ